MKAARTALTRATRRFVRRGEHGEPEGARQQAVLPAIVGVHELARRMDDDFDVNEGGFTWWRDHELDSSTKTGIMDCLCGLVVIIDPNSPS